MNKRNVIITIISVLILSCLFAFAKTTTTDLTLVKPTWTENIDILNDINSNSDLLEAFANDPLEFDTGERLEDRAGAMWTGNTETFIALTYQDADNTIDAVVSVKDEDNMVSNSATFLCTQQSIKTYVDTFQPLDTALTNISALTYVSASFIKLTADDTYAVRTLAQTLSDIGAEGDLSNEAGLYAALSDVSDFVQADEVNSVDSAMYTDASIDHEHLAPDVISGMADVTSADTDYILIWDVTDSALKKCDMGEVRGGGNAATFTCTDNESEALACPLVFVDGATGAQGAETDDIDFTYNPSTGTLKVTALDLTTALPDVEVANDITVDSATSYVKSEIRLITSDANPDTTGEIKHDSTVAGFLGGAIRWFDNDSIRILVDLETDPVDGDDDKVVAWDSTADGWYMKTDATGAGGSAITFDIGDDGGNDSVDVNEIATTGDTNSIFTEPTADKILIALANNWPGADLATLATTITITDNENTAENNPICFVAGADPDGGSLGIETDGDLHYNPSTGLVTATAFAGSGASLTGANTGFTSILNAALYVGRDTDNTINFATDNHIIFKTSGATGMEVDSTGELDMNANAVGFTLQTATGDGTTTIDWKLGNKFKFTFGAQNDTLTFTAPTNPCTLMLTIVQDGTGSRTMTWPATVKWAGGTAPTLTTTPNARDKVALDWDGAQYDGVASLDFK